MIRALPAVTLAMLLSAGEPLAAREASDRSPARPKSGCQSLLSTDPELLRAVEALAEERLAMAEWDASLADAGQRRYLGDVATSAVADLTILLSELPALGFLHREPAPRLGQIYGLLADLFLLSGRRELAAEAYRRAAGNETYCGAHYDGKLHTVELWRHRRGRLRLSHYLLVRDPRTWRVQERFLLPGFPDGFRIAAGELEVLHRPAPEERRAIRLADGQPSYPVWVPGGDDPLARLRSLDAAWVLADNFVSDNDGRIAGFRPRKKPRDDLPADLAELETALRAAIDEDPTQPWHRFFLGHSLWHQGRRPQAAAVWEAMLAGEFRATPYYEWAWMAQRFELYGQPAWADAAYRRARDHRRRLPRPAARSSAAERRLAAPFVKSWVGAAAAPELDPERAYLWWLRAREISGPAAGDGFRAVLWADYFDRVGDEERAAAERAYLDETRRHPWLYPAWVDYALWALYAALAGLLFLPLAYLLAGVRPALIWLFPGRLILVRAAIPFLFAAAIFLGFLSPQDPLPWIAGALGLALLIAAASRAMRKRLLWTVFFVLVVGLVPRAFDALLHPESPQPQPLAIPLVIALLVLLGAGRIAKRTSLSGLRRRAAIVLVPVLVGAAAFVATTFTIVVVNDLMPNILNSPDAPSDAFFVSVPRRWYLADASPERKYEVALDDHATGDAASARKLYASLPSRLRPRDHLAALDRGLPPWIHQPSAGDRRPRLDLVAAAKVWLGYEIWKPRHAFWALQWYVEDLSRIVEDAAMQAGLLPVTRSRLVLAGLVGLALVTLSRLRRWLRRRWLVLIPGSFAFLAGRPLRAFLTFVLFAFAFGPSLWLLSAFVAEQPSPGFLAAEAPLPQVDEIALPPGSVDQLVAESFWSLLWVYPGARLFYLMVAFSLAAALTLHVREVRSAGSVPQDSRDWLIETLASYPMECGVLVRH